MEVETEVPRKCEHTLCTLARTHAHTHSLKDFYNNYDNLSVTTVLTS